MKLKAGRFVRLSLAYLLISLLACCGCEPESQPQQPDSGNHEHLIRQARLCHDAVKFRAIPASSGVQTLPIICDSSGSEDTTISVSLDGAHIQQIAIQTPPHKSKLVKINGETNFFEGILKHIGTVRLKDKDTEDLFLVREYGASGGTGIILDLIDIDSAKGIGLHMFFSADPLKPATQIDLSPNFNDEKFTPERAFLDQIKYFYGFASEDDIIAQPENDKYAWYFWARDNAQTTDGPLKLTPHPGKYSTPATVLDSVKSGDITYTAYFKAGVMAYDAASDTHFPVYHPAYYYSWPADLEIAGKCLIITTRGEGLIAINTENHHIKHIKTDISVKSLRISGDLIIVNDKHQFPIPFH